MLKGKDFGAAIARAIRLKLDSGAASSKAEIARHFSIKPPSLQDWENKGTVAKDKLPELWRFFADVAGPEHWGISADEWPIGLRGHRPVLSQPAPPQPIDSDFLLRCFDAASRWGNTGQRKLDARQRLKLACHLYERFFNSRPGCDVMIDVLDTLAECGGAEKLDSWIS